MMHSVAYVSTSPSHRIVSCRTSLTGKVFLGAASRKADVDLAGLTSGTDLGRGGVSQSCEGSDDDGGVLHFCGG